MKHLILTFLFTPFVMASPGVDAGNGTLSDELDRIFPGNPRYEYEDTSFQEYIYEFLLGDEAYISVELAKLDFQRDVFNEYTSRWWRENDPEGFRRKLYWQYYFKGKNWYSSISASLNHANYCGALKDLLKAGAQFEENWQSEAFRRGVVSEAPECWITGLEERVRDLFVKIEDLEKILFRIQRKVSRARLDEKQTKELQKLLNEKVKRTVVDTLSASEEPFLTALQIPELDKEVISAAARIIAVRIGCGDKCEVKYYEPAITDLSVADLYLYFDRGSNSVGQLQPRVDTSRLIRKAISYLRNENPNDMLVQSQIDVIKSRLALVDARANTQIDNLRARFARVKSDAIEDLRLSHLDFWQDLFPIAARERVIRTFSKLKFQMTSYERLLLSTQYEATRFSEIAYYYDQALQTAAGISMNVYMPERRFPLAVDEITREEILIDVESQLLPSGYLLGKNREEVDEMVNILSID